VATEPEELPRLDELLSRGRANGLTGLRKLDRPALRKIEPHVGGLAGAHVPEEGIVDYRQVCDRLLFRVRERGGNVITNSKATRIERTGSSWGVFTAKDEFSADFLINCAGLHSDRVAALAGEKSRVRIVPFRGEYYKLTPSSQALVRHLIYPVPNPEYPFLGVHFTRLIHGGVEAGPNAVLAFAREGYNLWTLNARDLAEALSFPGLWRFLKRNPRLVWRETIQSLSKQRFCAALQKLIPEIHPLDLETGGAGVRAQAMAPSGELVQDFDFVASEGALHVLNAPSPAATASLAIGEEIVTRLA
jgi:L-2-hydroxyglutarate oxidase